MQTPTTDITPDAYITIVIDPFTAPWQNPSVEQQTFTVANFQPLSFIPVLTPPVQGRFTITQPSGSGPSYVPGNIVISGTGALTICFKVISGAGSAATRYTETGLMFGLITVAGQLERGNSRTGRDNFPSFVSSDAGILVTNDDKFSGSYEFVIVIQNADAGVAVVDPRITNSS